jgi:uncharacterized membrane protein YdjX (TVP38/TMEM64 family)
VGKSAPFRHFPVLADFSPRLPVCYNDLVKRKKLLFAALLLLVSWLILQKLTSFISLEEFNRFVTSLGVFGPLAVIGYTVISHVFAPLGGTPGLIVGVAAFGFAKTLILAYVASLISAAINFYLARRFGRTLVIRLAGKKAIGDIDRFAKVAGYKALALSRLFGFSLFELVSYAAGLTKLDFKKYFSVTAVFTLIPFLILFLLFKDSSFSQESLALWLATLILNGLVFSLVFKKYLKKAGR